MDQDFDRIEEELQKKNEPQKKHKVSGRSVFKLKKIIEEKDQQKSEPSSEEN